MFYDFAVAVPANTLESAPVIQELKLTYGVIHMVRILFPPGPHGMVKLQLRENGHQFLPSNPEGYFASDDEVIVIDEYKEMEQAPYRLKAVAWSPGTTYPHTLSVRIGVLTKEEMFPETGVMASLKKFLRMVGVG